MCTPGPQFGIHDTADQISNPSVPRTSVRTKRTRGGVRPRRLDWHIDSPPDYAKAPTATTNHQQGRNCAETVFPRTHPKKLRGSGIGLNQFRFKFWFSWSTRIFQNPARVSFTEPARARRQDEMPIKLNATPMAVARGVVRGEPRVSTADLPHLADVVLSCVHFYKRASTAGSLECRGRPWSRIPPRPTQGQPPAVGEVEGTTTRQHCSSAVIWRSSPRADTHERPPAKRHHACLPASL